jgi:hypothetical protein
VAVETAEVIGLGVKTGSGASSTEIGVATAPIPEGSGLPAQIPPRPKSGGKMSRGRGLIALRENPFDGAGGLVRSITVTVFVFVFVFMFVVVFVFVLI